MQKRRQPVGDMTTPTSQRRDIAYSTNDFDSLKGQQKVPPVAARCRPVTEKPHGGTNSIYTADVDRATETEPRAHGIAARSTDARDSARCDGRAKYWDCCGKQPVRKQPGYCLIRGGPLPGPARLGTVPYWSHISNCSSCSRSARSILPGSSIRATARLVLAARHRRRASMGCVSLVGGPLGSISPV
jgi:hypothetical protein